MKRQLSRTLLGVVIWVLAPACAEAPPAVQLVNSTSATVQYVFGDSDLASRRPLSPGARIEPPETWASMIYIERGMPGADPLHFLVEPDSGDPEVPILLVLAGHSLYVVDANDWPGSQPADEEAVAALAARRILPLD